jgi:exosortase A
MIGMDAEVTPKLALASEAKAPSTYGTDWRRAGLVMLLASAVVLGLFHDLVAPAVEIWWRSETFNHCFLVLPLAGYMAWQRRAYALAFRPAPDLRALALLPVIGIGYLLMRFAGIVELQQHAVMAMLQVLFLAVLGWPAYRALLWPLLYLFFLVPSGEFLVPWLQDYTAWFSIRALMVTGIPVWADGTFITTPTGNFEVAVACAGVRFLIASLAFGALYADVMYRSAWRKAAFLAASVIVPIIANGFRAYGIVILAHLTDNAAAVAADHIIYGWVFFSFIMLLLMLIGNQYREDDLPYGTAPARPLPATPTSRLVLAAVGSVALIAVMPAWGQVVEGRLAPIRAEAFAGLQPGEGWRATPTRAQGWSPSFPQADATAHRAYTDGNRRVELFIAYFASQTSTKKVIGGDNKLDVNERWRRISGETATNAIADTGLRPIAERHAGPTHQRQIWYLYWIDGQFVTSGIKAKLLQASGMLRGGGQGAAMIAIAADHRPDEGDLAAAALADFSRSLPPLAPVLRQLAGMP